MSHADDDRRLTPSPGVVEWLLVALNAGMAIATPFVPDLTSKTRIIALVFFTSMALFAAGGILRKWRQRAARASGLRLRIPGGVPIRPSRLQVLRLGFGILVVGSATLIWGRQFGVVLWSVGWVVAAVGGLLLCALALGLIPAGFVLFDPGGMTFGQRGWAFTVGWGSVTRVAAGEFRGNPVLYVWVERPEALVARPLERQAQLSALLASNQKFTNAPIVLMTAPFELDLPGLVAELERYVAQPEARSELLAPHVAS